MNRQTTPTDQYFDGIPLPLTDLSQLRLTAANLQALREARRDRMKTLLPPEQKRLRASARQAKCRNSKDAPLLQRGVQRTIAQYEKNQDTWETWLPPYVGSKDAEGLSFDPEAVHHGGIEIRDCYGLKTSLGEQSNRPDQRALREGRTLDAAVQDWIVNLYANLCDWYPSKRSGRKSCQEVSFFGVKRRTRPLALTVRVVNHYLPDLHLTAMALEKVLRPRLDREKFAREKLRKNRQAIHKDASKTIQSIRQRTPQRDTRHLD